MDNNPQYSYSERKSLYVNFKFPWIGTIPASWSIAKIKYSAYVKGRVGWQGLNSDEFTDEGPYLVTGTDFAKGFLNWTSCYHVSEERFLQDPYIVLHEGDLLVTKDGTIGKLAIVSNKPEKVTLNSGIFVVRPLHEKFLSKYLYWVLSSKLFSTYIDLTKSGTTIIHLYQEVFINFTFPTPVIQEQRAIVDFLDRETTRIDALIAKYQRLLELLDEKRASLINQVVTKGLDPSAPMKDSGVASIGAIPKNWRFCKLKEVAIIRFSNVDKKSYEGEQEVILCNYIDVYKNEIISQDIDFMKSSASANEIDSFKLKNGDVIITKDSESWKDICVPAYLPEAITNLVCGYHLAIIRPNQNQMYGAYLHRLLQSRAINYHSEIETTGVTRYGIDYYAIANLPALVPPFSDQISIVNFIEGKSKKIKEINASIQKLIALLFEYRTTLISATVTGKIKVK